MAQMARQVLVPSSVVALASEPAVRFVIDPPLGDQLSQRRVVIQYRAENLHIVPVFGSTAWAVFFRIGYIL
jgi:hypothetical protein